MTQVTAVPPAESGEPVQAGAPGTAPPEAAGPRPRGARHQARAVSLARSLVALTKPRIIELLLITTLPAMFLADHGVPTLRLIAVTLLGGAMAAGCANTLNCVIDRDIDAVMRRTARRPLIQQQQPAGPAQARQRAAVRPAQAVASAAVLGAGATILLGLGANWLAAALADAAIAFYVVVYTLWLKRRSASNIVIGGAAGCLPVLVGWAAVTGRVGWPAVVLFGVVFFWTPPHFWALAMKFKDDYATARIPMLPVIASREVVVRKIVAYSWVMVATSLILTWWAGWLYGLAALALGAWFLRVAHRLRQPGADGQAPMRLFRSSIAYLSMLFAVVAVTAVLPWNP